MKPPLSPSYKFEKEEGGEGLEEEEGEAAPPAVIPGSATALEQKWKQLEPDRILIDSLDHKITAKLQ